MSIGAASDVGWVVGHSYIVYAPLFAELCAWFCLKANRLAHQMRLRSGG